MKFAHLADCHIGAWRDQKLNDLNALAFNKALDICNDLKVDFILIAGDLFNTAYPGIDKLKEITKKLKEIKDANIRVYLIPGSHDFSPTGKTMLDVLEKAGLAVNVVKGEVINNKLSLHFTLDEPTGVKITGLLGRKGQLERKYYEQLILEDLEQEGGFKIFMFHTSLTELKPTELEKMESTELSYLPRNFDYYAGGHIHIVKELSLPGYKNVVYPGPLFPNSFSELEKLQQGGFYVFEQDEETRKETLVFTPLRMKNVKNILKDCAGKDPLRIERELVEEVSAVDVDDQIVLLRLQGRLRTGKRSDLNLNGVMDVLLDKGAYVVMKNTSNIESDEFDEIKIESTDPVEREEKIISEHLGQIPLFQYSQEQEKKAIQQLLHTLSQQKKDGETKTEYEKRMKAAVEEMLDVQF